MCIKSHINLGKVPRSLKTTSVTTAADMWNIKVPKMPLKNHFFFLKHGVFFPILLFTLFSVCLLIIDQLIVSYSHVLHQSSIHKWIECENVFIINLRYCEFIHSLAFSTWNAQNLFPFFCWISFSCRCIFAVKMLCVN